MDHGQAGDYRGRLLRALRQRVEIFLESGNQESLTGKAALSEAQALARLAITPDEPLAEIDVEAHLALGWLHWCRSQVLPEGQNRADLSAARGLFSAIAEMLPDALPAQLRHLSGIDQGLPPLVLAAVVDA